MNPLSLLRTIVDALRLLRDIINLAKEAEKEHWIQNGQRLTIRITGASNDEERKDLVEARANHYNNMPK